MNIEKTQVAVHPNVTTDAKGNLYSLTKMPMEDLPRLVEDCWHFREKHYCEGLFRVPVPATLNAKPAFFTAVVKYVDGYMLHYQMAISPLDKAHQVVDMRAMNDGNPITARFAELIVASNEWLKQGHVNGNGQEIKPCTDRPYEIINFRGLPEKDVPPYPLEIVKNMAGQHACCYQYTLADLMAATSFWSHHCLLRRQ